MPNSNGQLNPDDQEYLRQLVQQAQANPQQASDNYSNLAAQNRQLEQQANAPISDNPQTPPAAQDQEYLRQLAQYKANPQQAQLDSMKITQDQGNMMSNPQMQGPQSQEVTLPAQQIATQGVPQPMGPKPQLSLPMQAAQYMIGNNPTEQTGNKPVPADAIQESHPENFIPLDMAAGIASDAGRAGLGMMAKGAGEAAGEAALKDAASTAGKDITQNSLGNMAGNQASLSKLQALKNMVAEDAGATGRTTFSEAKPSSTLSYGKGGNASSSNRDLVNAVNLQNKLANRKKQGY